MNDIDLKQNISLLISEQMQCVLATVSGKQPCQHLMAYDFTADLAKIYLATYSDTQKSQNMLANPCVSLLWDNRIGKQQDHKDCFSLIASGHAGHLPRSFENEVRAALLVRNPSLDALLNDSRCKLFVVRISNYRWTCGYQQILDYPVV